jgi:2-amino-4-hydroxy-6-hydroxymethyldihydropteridine diphosphokinase
MILIAIGANLPGPDGTTPLQTCRRAVVALDALPGLRLRGLSAWYETAPVPVSDQPLYINAVAHLCAEATSSLTDPAELLHALQSIEHAGGRVRGAVNAARALDLDIIAMGKAGQLVRGAPDPILPHPRAHEREFVLAPLRDVAPYWMHPLLHRSVGDLLAAVEPQGVRPNRRGRACSNHQRL